MLRIVLEFTESYVTFMSFQPRLPNSTQSTDLPQDFRSRAAEVFRATFPDEAELGEFVVDGRIYPNEVLLRLGYLPQDQIRQINFEASVDYDTKKLEERGLTTMEPLFLCVDVLGAVMEEHFADAAKEDNEFDDLSSDDLTEMDGLDEVEEESLFGDRYPLEWTEIDFEGETVFLKFSTINTRLEDEADRLLGLGREAFQIGAPETGDALDHDDGSTIDPTGTEQPDSSRSGSRRDGEFDSRSAADTGGSHPRPSSHSLIDGELSEDLSAELRAQLAKWRASGDRSDLLN
jgi:hypothetical protein